MKVWSSNHWAPREFPVASFLGWEVWVHISKVTQFVSDHKLKKKKKERKEKSHLLISCPSEVEIQSWILTPGLALTLTPPPPSWLSWWLNSKEPACQSIQETQEMRIWPLGREDALGKGMATHSSILAWRIPWTEEPGGPQSMGTESDTTEWLSTWTPQL